MKKSNRNDIRREYDFASMKGGVRGKYAARYRAGTNLVLLDPEVAQAFPTDAAVNQTLRAVMDMANDVRLPGRAQEAQLAQIAITAGTDAEQLVKDAALRLLEQDARFCAAVREGIAQADRGEFIEEEEMDARLEQMFRS